MNECIKCFEKLRSELLSGKKFLFQTKSNKTFEVFMKRESSVIYLINSNGNKRRLVNRDIERFCWGEEVRDSDSRVYLKSIFEQYCPQKGKAMQKFPLNQIFYGPPGTGKSYQAIKRALLIVEEDLEVVPHYFLQGRVVDDTSQAERAQELRSLRDILLLEPNLQKPYLYALFRYYQQVGQIEFITFHQSYSYEEFVEGIRPCGIKRGCKEEKLRYEIVDGVFKRVVKRALQKRSEKYVLIIDEINRGNISKIFGELITLIEESKRIGNDEEVVVRLPYSGEEFGVPNNLYIIGTMNSADRSIALMDTALRRRFSFVEMMPKPQTLRVAGGIDLRKLLKRVNERIEYLLDRDHTIGHSYFMDIQTFSDLEALFKNRIIPLLAEYFFDDWEKIRLVLGDNQVKSESYQFIKKKKAKELFGENFDEYEDKVLYEINEAAFKEPKSYQKIYEKIDDDTSA